MKALQIIHEGQYYVTLLKYGINLLIGDQFFPVTVDNLLERHFKADLH